MLSSHTIPHPVLELIDQLAKVPSVLKPSVNQALYDYLVELLDEQVLDGRTYSVLSEHLQDVFFDASSLTSTPTEKINSQLLHIADAVELLDKMARITSPEQEIECECDIGIFIDRIHREVKLGLTEEIELNFYRHWMSRALFNRPANDPYIVEQV